MSGYTFRADAFTCAIDDLETAQLDILGLLKKAQTAFNKSTLYPFLGELVSAHTIATQILEGMDDLEKAFPREVIGVDLEKGEVVTESPELTEGEIEAVAACVKWAQPLIEKAIDEGRALFEFVEGHSTLKEVGIVPAYNQEGYFLVSDNEGEAIRVFEYTISIFTSGTERYRSLRTSQIRSVQQDVSPEDIKVSLMDERRDLPNPATWFFDEEMGFPFEPTVLPVAKRKFMRYLFGSYNA